MYPTQKKIPTLLALFILLSGLGATMYLDQFSQTLFTSASESPIPQDIRFSNISDSSFTVSWTTSSPTTGSIQITGLGSSSTFFDDLDADNTPRARNTHLITVHNLKENSSYSIKIFSGTGCKNEISCPTITQKTGNKLSAGTQYPPAHGSILTQQNTPADSSLVYILIGKSAPLASRVDSSGRWVIPLTNLRTQDLMNRLTINDSDLVQITVQKSPTDNATAVIDAKTIRLNLAIPPITLGNTYNFINTQAKNTTPNNILGTSQQATVPPTQPGPFDVLFPKQNNDTTQDKRPRFRGTGKSGAQLTVTVTSPTQTGKVTVGSDGIWTWRPSKELSAGLHQFSVQGSDATKKPITINRPFVVLKSGQSVLGDSTPSASLSPTTEPTEAPVPTIEQTPSPTTSVEPSVTLTPTTTPTVQPTATPEPTSTQLPLPSSPPPRSGGIEPTFLLFGLGIVLLGFGMKFIL